MSDGVTSSGQGLSNLQTQAMPDSRVVPRDSGPQPECMERLGGAWVTGGRGVIRVVVPEGRAGPAAQAGRMLAEELRLRHRIPTRLTTAYRHSQGAQAIVVSTRDTRSRVPVLAKLAEMLGLCRHPGPEGFTLHRVPQPSLDLVVEGADPLGALFGVGYLLREARSAGAWLELPAAGPIASTPVVRVRGVQLGYRAVNNTIHTWGLDQFERYLRDLLVFGCNTVELTPPERPPESEPASAERARDWEKNLRLAELAHAYGVAVSLWLPVSEHDARTPDGREAIVSDRRRLFESMAHIDHLFTPGGDPGETPVEVLLPLLARIAEVLHETHPSAGMWVSHQGFEPPERDRFYRYLQRARPEWLSGVVYGPWTRDTIEGTREAVPAEYLVRAYPDITHSCRCQYPVPGWDQPYAIVEGREVCNPRPRHYRQVFDRLLPHCDGFVVYSDGCHDDANKFLWLALGWNPRATTGECLRQYGRAFVGHDAAQAVSRGLLGLERNWVGPVARNSAVPATLALWNDLSVDRSANWRVQLHRFRALCDRYVQLRTRLDVDRERNATTALKAYLRGRTSFESAAERAARALDAELPEALLVMRGELWSLGRKLRATIGLKMSTKLGGRDERGNVLDYLDEPLNNSRWLSAQMRMVAELPRGERRAALREVLAWEDPGPGGYYDNLGRVGCQPHLVGVDSAETDPDCLGHPYCDFVFGDPYGASRLSWRCQATSLYDAPLQLCYTGLDPAAQYLLRVVYAGRFRTTVTLVANGGLWIHGALAMPVPPRVLEFDIPLEATAGGQLLLEWRRVETAGRGPQVAEVWLVRREQLGGRGA